MKNTILSLLTKKQDFVSGQEMCETLQVSRTAIWKHIKALKEEGYQIESVTRKGYRLLEKPDQLTEASLLAVMPSELLQGEVKVYDVIDSTNEEAKRRAACGAGDRSLYLADQQTGGKGRRGRQWISPQGKDVFYSLLLRPEEIQPQEASMITLLAALAGVRAAKRYTGSAFQIKWPNDIICNRKKVCGILTEMSLEMESRQIDYLVLGVGWNLNREEFDPEIQAMAGSVFTESGIKVDRCEFVAMFIEEFMAYYNRFLQVKNLSFCMEEYNSLLVNMDQEVKLIEKGQEKHRISKGINRQGELLVVDEKGNTEAIFSGEVSVRGLYGYV